MLESADAAEFFLTARPLKSRPPAEQAQAIFPAIRDVLVKHEARLLQERIFATDEAFQTILPVRAAAYGDLDDGVPPLTLSVPEEACGALIGVQVHAVRSATAPEVFRCENGPCGRRVGAGGFDYMALSGLLAPDAGTATDQARAVFQKARAALKETGSDMLSVARTWLWLKDILSWYDDFNGVRNQFFVDCGLIGTDHKERRLPASTGIGVGPAGRPSCALDVVAMIGRQASVECFHAAGMQRCAYNYGSAFSRMAKATTPAGKTVYISGTAAIDEEGKSQHIGDARGQVGMTVANVQACLRDMNCTDGDVVQAIAYSKTPEVEALFREEWADLGWPCLLTISDICRDDLLFEVEATACPGARRLA